MHHPPLTNGCCIIKWFEFCYNLAILINAVLLVKAIFNPIRSKRFTRTLLVLVVLFMARPIHAQFYNGSNMSFGKNRVQYREFLWTYYKFDDIDTYFYRNGKELAQYTAQFARLKIPEIESKIESGLDKKIQFIIFNNLTDLKQSNIGLMSEQDYNTGGITHIIGSKVFIYFNGNHIHFEEQIKAGIAEVLFNQMMFGGSLGKQVKKSTFFSLPAWYKIGIISYLSKDWNVDFDNHLRDGVLSGRYNKLNNLGGEDALYAGHSLWRFIAMRYGNSAVSNIIHMTSVSNSIDKGFLYVTGMPYKLMIKEWRDYYREEYESSAPDKDEPEQLLPFRFKKDIVYGQAHYSPTGDYLAYTSNESGKVKIYLYDPLTQKRKKIFKSGVMIDTKTDYSYPLLAWHPTGKLLAYIVEEKGFIWLYLYNLEEKKYNKQILYNIQKVTDFAYSDNGQNLLMSAVQNGQSDIFIFNIAASSFEQITNDIYSDLNPRFINNSRQIVFSSNRINDTLGKEEKGMVDLPKYFDLFVYDYSKHEPVLRRITETAAASELRPEPVGYNAISYLSDQNGIYNSYLAVLDSAVSSVDTTIHYRYFVHSKAVSNYSRNIIDQQTSIGAGKKAFIYFHENQWKIYSKSLDSYANTPEILLEQTPFMALLHDDIKNLPTTSKQETIVETEPKKEQDESASRQKRKRFYMVYFDDEGKEVIGRSKGQFVDAAGEIISGSSLSDGAVPGTFTIPKRLNYNVEYFINQLVSQVDFNFINYNYQSFTGGGPIYLNPGFNLFFQVGVTDLMEDYRMAGGVRLNFSLTNNEYLFSYANLKKRLDKEIVFHRNTIEVSGTYSLYRIHSHELFYILKWPFNEALSLRGTAFFRNEMYVALSTDQYNLEIPNLFANWLGAKAELVFDNTRSLGMNLYKGTRYKVFAEYHHMVGVIEEYKYIPQDRNYNLFVLGADFRHYTKIHRNFIWANRFAASTSFGDSPLIYYMGGVDNWMFPKFNDNTPIDYSQNYAYQTLATNMRGFNQNIRNGNSFAVINSELRFPVFSYFSNTPISSSFLRNFQLVAFGDIGTAWTGFNPYSKDNALFTSYVDNGPLHVSVEIQKEPIVGGLGFGARAHLMGYFIRGDVSWGVEDHQFNKPVYYLSLSLDF